ncbi:folate-binding protein [Corynebacterium sp. P5848]|uniref:CAF17-like 4Fe-4S cluster assembly/insertion protein YgfZ n=1 Tax=Corynebacterium marambiense TaxID=2765364 RepID=UPI0022609F5A|nr:folate-binding protein [Corynebacterium marambiense]MCX7543176.1 folate-binding protein [Corynebacterium marambiense]
MDSDNSTYRSVLLNRPGAQPALGPDAASDTAGVAWHYGAPLVEQRGVEDPGVVVDRSHRTVISVGGPDAADYLNRLLSQKLDAVADGYSAAALNLDAQGRILHHADLTVTDGVFHLDLPEPSAHTLVDYLERMKFWSEVEIRITDLGILTVLGATPPPPPESAYVRDVDWRGPVRRDIAVPRAQLDAVVDELCSLRGGGLRLAGLMAWTAERVKALEPEVAADLDPRSIPHEVPHWIGSEDHPGAVHLEKGCYRGQETVSRVHNLGRSPRSLVLLHLDGSAPELPETGAPVVDRGRTVGRVGTVVHDCDYGPIALALVKRSAQKSTGLTAGDGVAVSVDPDSIERERGIQPGRAAINRLKGLTD